MRPSWVAVLVTAGLFALCEWALVGSSGLTRLAVTDADPNNELAVAQVSGIDLGDLPRDVADRTDVSLVWRGAWELRASDLYSLAIESRGPASWTIDGHTALTVRSTDQESVSRVVWLAAGFHAIEIRYRPGMAQPHLAVLAARAGEPLDRLAPETLKPESPRNPWRRQGITALRTVLVWVVVLTTIVAIRRTSPVLRARATGWVRLPPWLATSPSRLIRPAAWLALSLILLYAALLRIDAITVRYGPVSTPAWLAAVQTRTVLAPSEIRPAWFPWVPAGVYPHKDAPPSRYSSDPYTYLKGARELSSFYEAQWREPAFLFAVKTMLALMHDQDVAVSFTSVAFAVLGVWLTYALGAALWSRPVGLLAALGLAIDREAAWFSSQGWRDDAFVAAVIAGIFLALRCWRRAREAPRFVHVGRIAIDAMYLEAMLLGATAGLIVLVRIMALSFLLPGAVLIVVAMRGNWRRRLAVAGLGLASATLVAAPYFVNCWRVYGDPLYTFNVHGNIYRIAEGKPETREGTLAYIRDKVAARPYATIDTIARGLTVYPFSNKWDGVDAWHKGLGTVVAVLAIAGMTVLAFAPAGRLVLLLGIASLLPFSLTWKVDPNWRFTAHVLPVLLIAAAVAVSVIARIGRAALFPGAAQMRSPWMRDRTASSTAANALAGAGTGIVALVLIWFAVWVSPQLLFAETLRFGESTDISPVVNQGFFRDGWTRPPDLRTPRVRVCVDKGEVDFRLPAEADYKVSIIVEAFPRPMTDLPEHFPVIEYALNGKTLGALPLQWKVSAVGTADITLPRSAVRAGINRLVLRVQAIDSPAGSRAPGLADGQAFALRLITVSPD